jgi:hypothetical protein
MNKKPLLLALLGCMLHMANPAQAEALDNWTLMSPPLLPASAKKIAEGGGQWVALRGNVIFHSTNGTEWSQVSIETNIDLEEAAYGNGRWIARGGRVRPNSCDAGAFVDLVLLTSTNGVNWELTGEALIDLLRMANSPLSGSQYVRIAFGNGRFLALHNSGGYLTSTNGVDWSVDNVRATPSEYDLRDLAYANGIWIAAGFGFHSLETLVYTSADAQTWTKQEVGSGPLITNIAFGNGEWLALESGINYAIEIWASSDTLNWTLRTTISSELAPGVFAGIDLNDLSYAAGHWVVAGTIQTNAFPPWPSDGKAGMILESADGISWSQHLFGEIGRLNGIAFINGQWIGTGGTGPWETDRRLEFATSTNGRDWEQYDDGKLDFTIQQVEHADGLWVAVGSIENGLPAIASSSNGVDWTVRRVGVQGGYTGITFGNGLWAAVGYENLNGEQPWIAMTLTSTNGINWNSHPADDQYYFRPYKISYGNGLWLAMGHEVLSGPDGLYRNHVTATATDGYTWTKSASPVGGLMDAVYANGLWVAVGTTGQYDNDAQPVIMTSPDGANWTSRTPGTAYGKLAAVAHHDGLWVAVGSEPAESPECWTSRALALTSSDGVTWNRQVLSIPHLSSLSAVGYGAGHWVLAGGGWMSSYHSGDYGLILTSTNGSAWNLTQLGYGRNFGASAITFAGGRFHLSTDNTKYSFQSAALFSSNPRLTIKREGHQLVLQIEGRAGTELILERSASLFNPDWGVVETITLASALHEIPLDPGEGQTAFWRTRTP